jgi:hypothetical protein
MAQAQTQTLHEPTLKPVSDLDESRVTGTHRNDPDLWKVKDEKRNVTEPPTRLKKKKSIGFFLVMAIALAATGGGIFYLKTHGVSPGMAKSVAQVASGASLPGPLEPSIAASVSPSTGAIGGTTASSQPVAKVTASAPTVTAPQNVAQTAAVTAMPDTAQNFAAIKVVETRLDDISKQVATMADDLKTLIAGHAQSKEQVAQLTERARTAPAPVVAAARPAQLMYQVARAPAPKPVPRQPVNTAAGSTNVVSVDMWNGTPSVAISEGDSIRFMSPGDVTAQGLTVKNADPISQQVTFGMPSGEEVIARVDARK